MLKLTPNQKNVITGTQDDRSLFVKNNRVTDDVIRHDKTEYSSQTLAEVEVGKYKNNWILVTGSRIGKWQDYQYQEENKVNTDNK